MNKYFVSIVFLSLTLASLISATDQKSSSVIKNASYVVFQGDNDTHLFLDHLPSSSKYAKFFTYDGQLLKTVEHHHNNWAMRNKLDLSAPKPQPVYYQIKYWPAIKVRAFLWFKITKGAPGDFIIFYDKHSNKIASYRFDKNTQVITVFSGPGYQIKKYKLNDPQSLQDFPLDLSRLNIGVGS